MVRKKQFTTRTGKDGSARYFTEHLSASDYYRSQGGILQGKTLEHLGMSKREVDLKVFSALEQNLHPETGERITLRTNNTRREWCLKRYRRSWPRIRASSQMRSSESVSRPKIKQWSWPNLWH